MRKRNRNTANAFIAGSCEYYKEWYGRDLLWHRNLDYSSPSTWTEALIPSQRDEFNDDPIWPGFYKYKACRHVTGSTRVFGGVFNHYRFKNQYQENHWTPGQNIAVFTNYLPMGLVPSVDIRARTPLTFCSKHIVSSTDAIGAIQRGLSDAKLLGFKDFNVLASIGELKDFRKMLDGLKFSKPDAYTASNQFLGFNFGILPFASDVKHVLDLCQNFGKAIEKWQREADRGLITRHSFSVLKNKQFNTETVHYMPYGDTVFLSDARAAAYQKTTETVTSIATVYILPLRIDSSSLNGVLASVLGMKKILSGAWQLVPWSFIVDWFISIGDMLEDIERNPPMLPMQIVSAGYSVKSSRTFYTTGGYDSKLTGHYHTSFGTISSDTTYERFALPVSLLSNMQISNPFNWKTDFSVMQGLLSAALGHQISRK